MYLNIFIIAIFKNNQSRFTKQDATGTSSTKEMKINKFPPRSQRGPKIQDATCRVDKEDPR